MRTVAHICAILLGLMAEACGAEANVGSTSRPSCIGDETLCEIVDGGATLDHMEVDVVFTQFLPELAPANRIPLEGAIEDLAGGSDGTVWAVARDKGELVVRQFDADGELGSAVLPAPAGLVDADSSYADIVSVTRGTPGPVVSVQWHDSCEDGEEPISNLRCPRREIIAFQRRVQDPPARTLLRGGLSDAASMFAGVGRVSALRGPEPEEYLVFGPGAFGWMAGRIDVVGNVAWQQAAFAQRLQVVGDPAAAVTFTSDSALSVVGELESETESGLALLELDWRTGNLSKRGYFDEGFLSGGISAVRHVSGVDAVRSVGDAHGRTIVAATDQNGDLAWIRVDGQRAEQVSLLRQDYTFLSPFELDVDAHGASYLLTGIGGRLEAVATLCQMTDGGDVACVLAGDSEDGNLSVDRFDMVAGNPGQVFMRDGSGELLRYDFPPSP